MTELSRLRARAAQKNAGSFMFLTLAASRVWSRLVRVAPRWWCRWRRILGVIADERVNYELLTVAGVITRFTCVVERDSSGVITQE